MHTPSSPRGRFGLLKSAPFSLAMLAASAMTANLAQADTVNVAAQTYDIPAGPLGSSLNRFAQQAGVAIVFQSHELEGLNGPGLKGQYATQEGFDRLLQGSGYRAVKGDQVYALQPMPTSSNGVMELGPTQVTANQLGNVTEDSSSYTPGSIATATRLVLTPKETPQSVSVIRNVARMMAPAESESVSKVTSPAQVAPAAAYSAARPASAARSISGLPFDWTTSNPAMPLRCSLMYSTISRSWETDTS